MRIFTAQFWKAAATRAAYTALAAALPLAGLVIAGDQTPAYAASVIALAAIASVVTSLVSLPEVDGAHLPFWRAVLTRTLRTAAQVAAPVLAAAVTLADIDPAALAVQIAGAAAVTLLRTLMAYLPEVGEAAAP